MRWIGCLLVLVIVPAGEALAQTPPHLEPGQRVRIQYTDTPTKHTVGRIAAIGPDTLLLRVERRHLDPRGRATFDSTLTTVPLAQVGTIARQIGRKSAAGTGALVGGVPMLFLGMLGGAIYASDDGDAAYVLGGAVEFGLVGAGLGALIGAIMRTDKWEDVPLDNLHVSITRGPQRRFGLAASIAF